MASEQGVSIHSKLFRYRFALYWAGYLSNLSSKHVEQWIFCQYLPFWVHLGLFSAKKLFACGMLLSAVTKHFRVRILKFIHLAIPLCVTSQRNHMKYDSRACGSNNKRSNDRTENGFIMAIKIAELWV